MLNRKTAVLAILALLLFACYPQKTWADGLTNKVALGWPLETQTFYIQASVTMAAFMTTQSQKKQSVCIDDWYFESDDIRKARNDHILDVMRKYPDHHPSAIILAILDKQCGLLEKPQK